MKRLITALCATLALSAHAEYYSGTDLLEKLRSSGNGRGGV